MLHPDVAAELLDAEIEVAVGLLGSRVTSLARQGTDIHCLLHGGLTVQLDGADYDSEPLGVRLVDQRGTVLAGSQWPQGLYSGEHPVLARPFACVRGTAEYHLHPSHLSDRWDTYRGRIQV